MNSNVYKAVANAQGMMPATMMYPARASMASYTRSRAESRSARKEATRLAVVRGTVGASAGGASLVSMARTTEGFLVASITDMVADMVAAIAADTATAADTELSGVASSGTPPGTPPGSGMPLQRIGLWADGYGRRGR